MEPPGGRDSRFQLGYSMNLLSGESPPEIYGGGLGRPSTSLQQLSPRHTMVSSACGTRGGLKTDVCYDERGLTPQHGMGFESSGVNDIHDESYSAMQAKKSPPSNGKKTKGRVKIKMEYIENKLRRYTTFSKRKTGIMKKAYELSTLTGTQVMLLVASETGHVYTFATRKLQPMITSEAGKALIQTCLNSPDPPVGSAGGDQRMSATGFEETELTYNISDEDSKEDLPGGDFSEIEEDDEDASEEEEEPPKKLHIQNNGTPQLSSSNNHSPSQTPISTAPETKDKSSIISQIKQFNNALIQSNKAKISIPSTSPPQPSKPVVPPPPQLQRVPPSTPLVITPQPPADSPKARPLVVKTPNGVAFASVAEGMILGITPESKYVIMPISSVANRGEIGIAPTTITVNR
ncbi:serum response factor homolog isoform X1 [Euwallacea fornicatus]|uniref:serum response factor homolog isoform X1 n=1 Tax=Euwallacea fornicatus TaxID=995702 RepID=UPI00338F1BE7